MVVCVIFVDTIHRKEAERSVKEMASGKRNARLNKSLFKQFKQEKGVDVEEVEEDLSDEDDQQWTKDETVLLMALIKTQLKERDTYSYIRRIQLLDWDQVCH